MKLSELKTMVAEEYGRYLYEQEIAPAAPTGGPAISVSDDDIQMGEDPEAMLRNIYDMLKAHFEMEDAGVGGPPMPPAGGPPMPPPMPAGDDDDMVDMGDEEEEEEDLAEIVNSDPRLHERKRMQKLANIIKG